MSEVQDTEERVQVCECLHGGVEDDDGNLVAPCPGGHGPDGCEVEATIWLYLIADEPNPAEMAHLCRACADSWIDDGDWVETESQELIDQAMTFYGRNASGDMDLDNNPRSVSGRES
jgi:hypothetical protein